MSEAKTIAFNLHSDLEVEILSPRNHSAEAVSIKLKMVSREKHGEEKMDLEDLLSEHECSLMKSFYILSSYVKI